VSALDLAWAAHHAYLAGSLMQVCASEHLTVRLRLLPVAAWVPRAYSITTLCVVIQIGFEPEPLSSIVVEIFYSVQDQRYDKPHAANIKKRLW
jgi:hypothetical protein